MSSSGDRFLELLRQVLDEHNVSQRQTVAILLGVSVRAGGARYYIPKPPTTTLRIGEAIASGLSVPDAARAAGVSQAAGYRHARKRWKCR